MDTFCQFICLTIAFSRTINNSDFLKISTNILNIFNKIDNMTRDRTLVRNSIHYQLESLSIIILSKGFLIIAVKASQIAKH